MADESKDYMPTQAGLAEGATGDQVSRLQQYLARYGYLESPTLATFGVDTRLQAAPSAEEGTFDESTASALRRFQEFNHLPVTGELDEATADLIRQPRCGFPDVAEFANTGRRWPSTSLTYGFQEFTPDLTQPQVVPAIEQALALWAARTTLCFRQVPIGTPPDIIIRFVADDHGDGNPFDGGGGVLAHAYYPPIPPAAPTAIQGDAHFDEAETWTVTIPPPSGTFDLVTVAGHEFGHSLGLGHSTVSGALMAAFYGGPHRWLHSDDVAGIQAIYGGYGIAHAMWTHGTSVQVEYPDRIEFIQRMGFFTRIVGKPNSNNWFHFAIPSPVIVDNKRLKVGPVILRFRTLAAQAYVRDVHVWDGSGLLALHNGVNLSGDHFFEPFGIPHCPPALWGLNISIGMEFRPGTPTNRTVDFIAAGCDFRP
jgi:peptidoglycan hydrolase-like protein with peptidoglycan-binding domain